jgi:hypothetical protein
MWLASIFNGIVALKLIIAFERKVAPATSEKGVMFNRFSSTNVSDRFSEEINSS